jgi:excisionase family DNA binding protein
MQDSSMLQPDLLLVSDAARLIGVSDKTIRLWERVGRLPARKTVRGVRLFDRRDVERLARERRATQSTAPDSATAGTV